MDWMFLPLKRYAEFSGRSRRTEYWMFVVLQILLGMAFWTLAAILGGAAIMGGDVRGLIAAGGMLMILIGVYGLISLALLIPAIAVGVRRLHDTNRSGWWLLSPFAGYVLTAIGGTMATGGSSGGSLLILLGGLVTLVMAVVLVVFMLLEGTRGPNRFGADPKAPAAGEVFA